MKLQEHIIITLPDFARYFDMLEFWANRHFFIRDMHPCKVYYWNDALVNAYSKICNWIDAEDGNVSSGEIRNEALQSLNTLTNKNICMDEFMSCFHEQDIDTESDIIVVKAPITLSLAAYDPNISIDNTLIKLHKICVTGTLGQKCEIKIGDALVGTLECGEVAYVTETNGGFIELLPNHALNQFFEARLLDNEGKFRSILMIKDKRSGETVRIRDVVSFALVGEGYIYIDFQDSIVCNNIDSPLFMLCDENAKVVAINSIDDVCYALYEGGFLRSTHFFNPIKSVFTKPNNKY